MGTALLKSNLKALFVCEGVYLYPGLNELDSEQVKLLEKSPFFPFRVENKHVEWVRVIGGKDLANQKKSEENLNKKESQTQEDMGSSSKEDDLDLSGGVTEDVSIEELDNIEDVSYLEELLETETRKDVKKAIKKRIKELS